MGIFCQTLSLPIAQNQFFFLARYGPLGLNLFCIPLKLFIPSPFYQKIGKNERNEECLLQTIYWIFTLFISISLSLQTNRSDQPKLPRSNLRSRTIRVFIRAIVWIFSIRGPQSINKSLEIYHLFISIQYKQLFGPDMNLSTNCRQNNSTRFFVCVILGSSQDDVNADGNNFIISSYLSRASEMYFFSYRCSFSVYISIIRKKNQI